MARVLQDLGPNLGARTGVNSTIMADEEFEDGGILHCILRWVVFAVSRALTALFAVVGAFAGATAGAFAGRASDIGLLRGAGLGAVAGAVLSVEVLEASRAYWCLEQSGSHSLSSMADFMEELLRDRFIEEQFSPAMLTTYRWQVNIADVSYDDYRDVYGRVPYEEGLSDDVLRKLPCHVVMDEIQAGQSHCTICLQDIELGETARILPGCHHIFHLMCVDKWLTRHRSCPICRQEV